MFLLTLMWVLYGWNTGNADYMNYNVSYYQSAVCAINYSQEVGFQLLCKLFYNFNLEYNQFLIIISIIGLALITSTIKKYTKNIAFVLAMYFMFPFMLDVVQVRNFMAMAIIVFALRFLIEKKKWGKAKYIILVVIASTFHYTAFFYLLFLLTEVRNVKKMTHYSIIIATVGALISYTGIIPPLVAEITSSAKVYMWFTNRMGLGMFIILLVHASTLFLVHYAYEKIKNLSVKYSCENGVNCAKKDLSKSFVEPKFVTPKSFDINMNFVNFAYKMNIVCLLMFPLYTFNMEFFRLYRNMFVINYILFSFFLVNVKYDKKEKSLYGFFVVVYVIVMAAYFFIIPNYDNVFSAVLHNNSLIGK
nr:EpsG family protein [Clostridium algidicarnis]